MKVRKLKFEFYVIVQHGEADEKKSTSVWEGEEAVGMERGRAVWRHKDLTAALFMRGHGGQSGKIRKKVCIIRLMNVGRRF